MASLILGAGILLHDKIKHDKAKRKEKKRKSYEERYNELEKEHKSGEAKYLERKQTGESAVVTDNTGTSEKQSAPRRSSSASQRSLHSINEHDSPARWVEEAQKERTRTQ